MEWRSRHHFGSAVPTCQSVFMDFKKRATTFVTFIHRNQIHFEIQPCKVAALPALAAAIHYNAYSKTGSDHVIIDGIVYVYTEQNFRGLPSLHFANHVHNPLLHASSVASCALNVNYDLILVFFIAIVLQL